MPKLPSLSSKNLLRILCCLDFYEIWQKGSHVVVKRSDGKGTVVPAHKNIKRGTLAAVLCQAVLTLADIEPYL